MKKTLAIAAVCFFAPIAVVVAMNPQAAQTTLHEAHQWAVKTFPPPPVVQEPPRRRG